MEDVGTLQELPRSEMTTISYTAASLVTTNGKHFIFNSNNLITVLETSTQEA